MARPRLPSCPALSGLRALPPTCAQEVPADVFQGRTARGSGGSGATAVQKASGRGCSGVGEARGWQRCGARTVQGQARAMGLCQDEGWKNEEQETKEGGLSGLPRPDSPSVMHRVGKNADSCP